MYVGQTETDMHESPPSRAELSAHHVLERVDRVPGDSGDDRLQQRARLHQALWREAHAFPQGTDPTRPRSGTNARPIGSRLEVNFALATGANFLSRSARDAAHHRVARPEPKQTLNPDRLYADLLSTMPMCFNLFGPLWPDPGTSPRVIGKVVVRTPKGFIPRSVRG